jgi:hypothetical protein
MTVSYPHSIQQFLDLQRYADAIQHCQSLGIDSSPITALVQARLEEALTTYSNGDFPASLVIFMTTIGVLEPSVVVSKFYRPDLMPLLVRYLMELHQRGFAKPSLTKLLFTLFARSEYQDEMVSFISFIESAQTQKHQPPIRSGRKSRETLIFS